MKNSVFHPQCHFILLSFPQIKTFTYEIPADTNVSTNKQFLYKNEHYNSSNTTNTNVYPERDIPYRVSSPQPPSTNQSTIYNTITTTNRNDVYPNEPRARSPQPEPITNKSIIYKRDTKETTTNVYPVLGGRGHTPQPPHTQQQIVSPPPGQSTIIYKHDVTNTNTNIHHPPPVGGVPVYPSEPSYLPPRGDAGYPPNPDVKHTYMYKHESSNTKNTVYGPPGGPVGAYSGDGYPSHGNYPPHGTLPAKPAHLTDTPSPSNNVMYKYSSTTTTRNTHGHPDDRQPLLAPAPFPTEGIEQTSQVDGHPPKRLDDLLASFPEVSFIVFQLLHELNCQPINLLLEWQRSEWLCSRRWTLCAS